MVKNTVYIYDLHTPWKLQKEALLAPQKGSL